MRPPLKNTVYYQLIVTLLYFFCATTVANSTTILNLNDEQLELRNYLQQAIDSSESFEDKYSAEVWLLDMSTRLEPFVSDSKERIHILRTVHYEATKAGLQPDLVLALIHIESRFDRFALSVAGAQGLMQIMPFWKKELGRQDDNFAHIETNLRYGCTILKFYLDKENGHLSRALARYNGSAGKTWYPEKVMTKWQDYWAAGQA
jgi:soluble lytic murein transglycosylase-like protein